MESSAACVAAAVFPVSAAALLPVALAAASNAEAVRSPPYSITTAAERSDACVMVTAVVPLETFGPYQISVVDPLELAACATRDQVTPPPLMAVTWPLAVPRVAITATRVLPFAGVVPSVTPMPVAALLPVLPVAVCTRVTARPPRIAWAPASLPARFAVPASDKSSPFTLLEIVRLAADTTVVPS